MSLLKGRRLAAAVLASSILLPQWSYTQDVSGPARLDGTFIQLWKTHEDWGPSQWEELFETFERMGLSKLVVQWTLYDETAYYDSHTYESLEDPPLERILEMADRADMKVVLGLAHDSGFWAKIVRDRALVEVFLKRLRLRSQSVALELAILARDHASFGGWYLSEEIDDSNWLEPERRELLEEHLREMVEFLHALSPTVPVAVSGFSKGRCDPISLEGFWRDVLKEAPVDLVLFQDGIGALHLELPYLSHYLSAVSRAVESRGGELGVVVETFRQVSGAPLNQEPFRAEPANIDRIERQLEIATSFAPEGRFAFAVPDYMSPTAGPEAERLYRSYLELLETK